MTKRIFRTVFTVAISVFISAVFLFMTVLYDYFSNVQRDQLRIQLDLASQGVVKEKGEYFNGLTVENYRITWIGKDGRVLYDSVSDADEMENHFEREEVKEAFESGYGESSRYSSTLTERYLYSAKRLDDGSVVRLSVTQHSLIVLTLGMLQPIIIIFAVAVILSAVLASRLAKKIVRPLNELNLDSPMENEGYDELAPLLRRIDTQQHQIKNQKDELRRKQREFEMVTSEMTEGMILLNQTGTVLSINRAAASLLNADMNAAGQDILSVSRSKALTEVLRKSASGDHAEAVAEFDAGWYQLDASPIMSGDEVIGTVLLMLDVTEKEKNEQLRREFTANVSHELKTPLHTISGSAELLSNGMVKKEDIPTFSKRIYSEAQRMIRLVDDIIHLSHLDEGAEDMKRDSIDLYALADEAVKSLSSEAESAEVSFKLCGEHVNICGIRQLIYGIIYNLCDNAVKYNRKGGSVTVSVKENEGFAVLSVADTGIGIPDEYKERIFERFYRIDKSHSKEIGGTGLGLSIVKHAARLHNAVVNVKSTVNEGTEITVKFPRA